MDISQLLIELNKNNFKIFHFNDNVCHINLQDDFEIMMQLSNNSISKERVDLLKAIL